MSDSIKLISLIFIILLGITSYHDLNQEEKAEPIITNSISNAHYDYKEDNFQVISVRVSQGENFLTIMEQINQHAITNIEQSTIDFQNLNPSASIYQLEDERVYLFPVYHSN